MTGVRIALIGTCGVALAVGAAAQQPAQPRFDIASIKPSGPREPYFFKMTTQVGAYWTARGAPLSVYLSFTFQLPLRRIEGIPIWARRPHFDVQVRMPASTTDAQFHLMLQSLFADRFHMVWRTDMRPTDVSILTAGPPGPDLHPAAGHCLAPGAAASPGDGRHQCGKVQFIKISKTGAEIAGYSVSDADVAAFFAETLVHPVVIESGSKALYDFDVTIPIPAPIAGEPPASRTIAAEKAVKTMFRKRLGWNLDLTKTVKRPMPVLVITHLSPLIAN